MVDSVVFTIANIRINISSETTGIVKRFKELYYNFIEPSMSGYDYSLEIKCVEMEKYIKTELLPFNNTTDLIQSNYIYSAAYDPINKKALLITNINNAYPFAEEYFLSLFTYLCLGNNKLLFHASFIYDRNFNAYIFYGPSGMGKSTVARNSLNYKILSDDLVIIEKEKSGLFKVHKTPFERNKKKQDEHGPFNLKGFYRLNHSSEIRLERLSGSQKISSILGNIWSVHFSKDSFEKYFQLVDRDFNRIPGYNLHLKNDSTFWDVILSAS